MNILYDPSEVCTVVNGEIISRRRQSYTTPPPWHERRRSSRLSKSAPYITWKTHGEPSTRTGASQHIDLHRRKSRGTPLSASAPPPPSIEVLRAPTEGNGILRNRAVFMCRPPMPGSVAVFARVAKKKSHRIRIWTIRPLHSISRRQMNTGPRRSVTAE